MTKLDLNWQEFKEFIDRYLITPFYIERPEKYHIYAVKEGVLFETVLLKRNTAQKNNFENNYKA